MVSTYVVKMFEILIIYRKCSHIVKHIGKSGLHRKYDKICGSSLTTFIYFLEVNMLTPFQIYTTIQYTFINFLFHDLIYILIT